MQAGASITYWFCVGVAVFMLLAGAWDTLFGGEGPGGLFLFCAMIAAVFYLAGSWARRRAREAAPNA